MAAFALADMLPDFGAPPRSARAGHSPVSDAAPPEAAPPSLEDELDRRIAEVVSETEAAVEARLAEEHARAFAEAEARHAGELARLRVELGDQAGKAIADRLERLESELVSATGTVVSRILGAALTDDVRRHAVAELASSILSAISDREAVRIAVTGPLFLYEALRPALGRFAERVEFSEAAGVDLTVSIDSSLYETRLGEWSSALAEVLA